MRKVRGHLTYANVMATLAVFIALGGASYAAIKVPKNSVGTKQLKKNAVTTGKIRKGAVTGAKVKNASLTGKQIDASTLGTVPLAQTASSLAPGEDWHEVGEPGEPEFKGSWHNGLYQTVAFYKDQEGIVHLRGDPENGTPLETSVFRLPPGYRPAAGEIYDAPGICFGGGCSGIGTFVVYGPGVLPGFDGMVVAPPAGVAVLNGIDFRAES